MTVDLWTLITISTAIHVSRTVNTPTIGNFYPNRPSRQRPRGASVTAKATGVGVLVGEVASRSGAAPLHQEVGSDSRLWDFYAWDHSVVLPNLTKRSVLFFTSSKTTELWLIFSLCVGCKKTRHSTASPAVAPTSLRVRSKAPMMRNEWKASISFFAKFPGSSP